MKSQRTETIIVAMKPMMLFANDLIAYRAKTTSAITKLNPPIIFNVELILVK